jgi:hypothetical protein
MVGQPKLCAQCHHLLLGGGTGMGVEGGGLGLGWVGLGGLFILHARGSN